MKQIYTILAVLALVALAFLTGRCSAEEHIAPSPVVTKTDTVSIRDTVTVDRPVYVDRLVTDTMLVSISDTVTLRDTAYIVIEREQKHYRSDDYEAWVSGYRPALDSIIVFPETKYITKETISVPSRKRWGLGLQAGYGIGVAGNKLYGVPYIGIGISYNILQW